MNNNSNNNDPFKDFDKHFARIQKHAFGFAIFSIVMTCIVIGGLGWAVYRLVEHFTK